jgi:YegS/Rv2252/BmrU family lipid kinase
MPDRIERRFVAILNPNADRGRTASLAATLERAIDGDGTDLRILATTRRGEAVDLAKESAERGCRAVVAIGGDGTVHEVVNGLMQAAAERRPALAVLPAGSGNDFAFALGLPKDLPRLVAALQGGGTRPVDVGQVRSADGRSRYFINNVGLLLEGVVNLASHELTWPRGSGLYLRAVVQSFLRSPPIAQLALNLDGAETSCSAANLSIGNGPRSGGRFLLFPDARVDDGRLDYLLARPMNRARLAWEILQSMHGRRGTKGRIVRGQFAALRLQADVPLAAHVDGEPWLRPAEDVRGIEAAVHPAAIRIVCGE